MNACSKLIEELINLEQKLFSGVATIIASDRKQWKIYFYRGMLIWAEGGSHVYRFWQRYLYRICPQADVELFDREKIYSNSITDYYFINTLIKNKLATRKQIYHLIEQKIVNIFFDIFQVENKQTIKIEVKDKSAHNLLKENFNLTLPPLEIYQLLSKAYRQWIVWQSKGLASCSPNLAPVLKKEITNSQIPPIIWTNMKRTLDGQRTLRDLALQTNKDVFQLTRSLIPYFLKGYIRLVEIPDLTEINLRSRRTHGGSRTSQDAMQTASRFALATAIGQADIFKAATSVH